MEFTDKYNNTIYYISPFYQRIFPKLTKLVVMDTDMEFQIDPAELYNEFEKFGMDQILGCGNDLAPHYHTVLEATGWVWDYLLKIVHFISNNFHLMPTRNM